MQIRLLSPFQFYKANQIVSLPMDWERYLIRNAQATYDLTGGTPYVPPGPVRKLVPASLVQDDKGVVLGTLGPRGQDVCNLRMGQSTENGSVYPQLVFTSASLSGNGKVVTATTTIANNLPVGDVVLARATGGAPAGYNTGALVAMTVGGIFPNCTLSWASTATGAQTTPATITIDQEAMAPELFRSQRFPAMCVPYAPALTYSGGYLAGLYDTCFDAGYNVHIVNAALGSLSLVQHVIGQLSSYGTSGSGPSDLGTPNQRFRNRRAASGYGDCGCVGSLIIGPLTNSLFELTAGGDDVYVYYNDPKPIKISANASAFAVDYVETAPGGVSGSIPNSAWAGKTAGQTVTDGGLTWTCISPNVVTDLDPSLRGAPSFTPFSEGRYGFDPFGVMRRSLQEGERAARGMAQKVATWMNAQSDLAATQAWYTSALVSWGNYVVKRGWKPEIGLSIFSPKANNAAAYDKLWAGAEAAITILQTAWPGMVFKGVNLSTEPTIGRVHGQGNLFTESDNTHIGENVHPQARCSRACIPLVAKSLLAVLNS